MNQNMRRKLRIFGLSTLTLLILLGLGGFGFLSYVNSQRTVDAIAVESLNSDSQVNVQVEPWLVFSPVAQTPSTGFIFYPGGLVDEVAYAPNARAIAAAGYLVVIPPMPLNLAVLNPNVASKIIAAYPQISHWAIGGHSLGGSMAAAFIDNNPEFIDGLALWASYPAGSNDLSDDDLQVTSIYGTLDGVAAPEEVTAARPLLPANTTWVPIEGGNHAQFGWYGSQNGDNPPAISHQAQSDQVIAATIALLQSLEH